MRTAGVGQWRPAVCERRSELNNPAVELECVCGVAAVSPHPSTALGRPTHLEQVDSFLVLKQPTDTADLQADTLRMVSELQAAMQACHLVCCNASV